MINAQPKQDIIDLYIKSYSDKNYAHFCEIIKDEFNYSVSDSALNRWLREKEILSPKAKRKTQRNMKKILKVKLDNTKSEKVKNEIKDSIYIIDSKEALPKKSRSKYMGEMIQMDASSYHWIKDEIWHLHLAMNDATGTVVAAYFDSQETLNAYYNVFCKILNNWVYQHCFIPTNELFSNTKEKTPLLMTKTLLLSSLKPFINWVLKLKRRAWF